MAWTQAEIDTLKKAIVAGVQTVEYGDKRVTYQSMEAMLKALAVAQEEVTNATADGATTYSLAAHDRD